MARFEDYAPILRRLEGGWANHPADKGGPTMMGVTLATFRRYYGQDKTAQDLKAMTEQQWTRIMRTYWDACQGDRIQNQSVAEMLVDWHINAGTRGIRQAQTALAVQADGIVGPKTLAALNEQPHSCVHCKLKKARLAYYEQQAKSTPSQAVFLAGWRNRVNQLQFKP